MTHGFLFTFSSSVREKSCSWWRTACQEPGGHFPVARGSFWLATNSNGNKATGRQELTGLSRPTHQDRLPLSHTDSLTTMSTTLRRAHASAPLPVMFKFFKRKWREEEEREERRRRRWKRPKDAVTDWNDSLRPAQWKQEQKHTHTLDIWVSFSTIFIIL